MPTLEFNPSTTHPVVIEILEHNPGNLGAAMRLRKRKTCSSRSEIRILLKWNLLIRELNMLSIISIYLRGWGKLMQPFVFDTAQYCFNGMNVGIFEKE